MNLDRQGLEIGPFDLLGLTINPTFHWHGLIIVMSIVAAAMVAAWMARRDNKDPGHVWNGMIWVVILGVIFARLWHVLFPSISSIEAGRTAQWYLTHPFDFNNGPLIIWGGGLSIFGAVLGGALGVVLYTYQKKLDILSWLDIGAVVVPLGQAIGRWGNFVNEELYGKPTNLPWGLKIENPPSQYTEYTRFHPLFLYESVWNLITFCVLLWIWRRLRARLKRGDILLIYLILYPTARFFLEFLRIEVTLSGGINVSQAVSASAALISMLLLIYRHHGILTQRLQRQPDSREEKPAI